MNRSKEIVIPLDVPRKVRDSFLRNYEKITHGTGRLMLFAGDQKVEHLNDDFFGNGIHPDDADPEHLFRIASQGKIGVFATQLGLIARYGMDYKDVPYLVKLNSKTHLIKTSQADPMSELWVDVEQVVQFREESGLDIPGVGFTVYPGSEHEPKLFREAAQVVYKAHQHGLVVVLWMYPRGKAVADERDPHLIAGVAGVGACLGADFVKVNYPQKEGMDPKEAFKEAVQAAGRTKVLCAGGASKEVEAFLRELHDQIYYCGAAGNATGRNIHQKSLPEAVRMCDAIYAITVEGATVEEALKIYRGF